MLVSLRERGRSIAEVTGNLTGRLGFILYICFTLLMIVIVTAAFLDLSVRALTSVAPAKLVQLPAANPFHWRMTAGPDGAAAGAHRRHRHGERDRDDALRAAHRLAAVQAPLEHAPGRR